MSLSRFLGAVLALVLFAVPAQAGRMQAETALFPVSKVLSDKDASLVRPSIVGARLVYSRRDGGDYSVIQAEVSDPSIVTRRLEATHLKEAVRFGVALEGGAVGYVSNRMGPVSAWMRQGRGDGHVAIANMGSFSGALVPMSLHASYDGRIWCFDTTMEKVLQSRAITQFSDEGKHPELLAQPWRFYDSNSFEHKLGYKSTESGHVSKFEPPSLFVFNRQSSQLTMIPNALNGAVSPDGKRVAFVRNTGGNYDIWMQDVDGGDLVQLSDTQFGEFEPAWSPDGRRIAFASNQDRGGAVLGMSIYVLDVDNGRVQRLTNAPHATDGAPTWQDTHTIVFHSNRDPSDPQGDTVSRWSLWQVKF